jgi:hypothetical protein
MVPGENSPHWLVALIYANAVFWIVLLALTLGGFNLRTADLAEMIVFAAFALSPIPVCTYLLYGR